MRRPVAIRVALALGLVLATAPQVLGATCPTRVHFAPDATGAVLDAGWSGIGHDVPVLGTALDLALSCAASESPCGTCSITGLVEAPAGSAWRCEDDTSIRCSVATEVANCGALGPCRYHASPPQSLATGGIAFCAMLVVDGPVGGSVGVESGALSVTLPLRTTLDQGVIFIPDDGGPNQGCPRCDGDPSPNDGVPGGTCDAGPRAGLGCDTNAVAPFVDFRSTSFDCPPAPSNRSDMQTRPLTLSTADQSAVVTADSPQCSAVGFGSLRCMCSTCNSLQAEPCASNVDCPPSGGNPGICGGKRCAGGSNAGAPCVQGSACPGSACARPGQESRPSGCSDDTVNPDDCSPDLDGEGICNAGPVDSYCSNLPNRGCLHDDDCDDVPGACGIRLRPCFRDNGTLGGSVTAAGTATPPVDGVAVPTALGGLTCARPTIDPFFNVLGLPGLVRLQQPGALLFDGAALPPCPASPASCRAPFVAKKATLDLRDRTPDEKDQLAWKWLRGSATTLQELGDPATTTDYALCLYDASGLRATMTIAAGGMCGTRPCWQPKSTGFRYRNKSGAPHGIQDLTLRAGADGKAQFQAKGKGLALPMPTLGSLTTALEVQVRNRATGLCWGATFSPPFDRITAEQLRDRAD